MYSFCQKFRSLYTLGLSRRYFNFDSLLYNQAEYVQTISMFSAMQKKLPSLDTHDREEEAEYPVLRDQVFYVLLYFSRSRDGGICEKALIALGIISYK